MAKTAKTACAAAAILTAVVALSCILAWIFLLPSVTSTDTIKADSTPTIGFDSASYPQPGTDGEDVDSTSQTAGASDEEAQKASSLAIPAERIEDPDEPAGAADPETPDGQSAQTQGATQGQPAQAQQTFEADTLYIGSEAIPYVDFYMASTAPKQGAGLWNGSDSTTDDSWGYFIGHNPGPFECVSELVDGNQVTVCDDDGNAHTYTVFDEFNVPRTTTWEDIQDQVTGYGESIVLQTCVGEDGYRIVLAD